MPKTEIQTETPETNVKEPSKKMKIASVVTATAVSVVLTVVAQTLIEKVAVKIQDRMNPENKEN